jgi:hypothetical protein
MRQEHSETFAQAEASPVRADFGGGERDPQGVGDLGHRQPFDVVQDDDGSLRGHFLWQRGRTVPCGESLR